MVSYTQNIGLKKPDTGTEAGSWGGSVNTMMDMIDSAINGIVTVVLPAVGTEGSPNDLDNPNGSTSSADGRNMFIELDDAGDLGGTAYVRITPNDAEKVFYVRNSLTNSQDAIVFQGNTAANGVTVPNGATVALKCNGGGASATVTMVDIEKYISGILMPNNTTFRWENAAGTNYTSLTSDGSDDFTMTVNGTTAANYVSSTDIWDFPALTINSVKPETLYEKDFGMESPSSSEDLPWFYTNRAITVSELVFVTKGTTPSTTVTIRHDTDRSAAGNEIVTGGTTVTSESTGDVVTSFNDATIPADSFVWIETTAQSGTVDWVSIHLQATID